MPTFRPSAMSSVILGALALTCLMLASWQWERRASRQAQIDAFEHAPDAGMAINVSQVVEEALSQPNAPYMRLSANGRFDSRSFLLDNQIFRGRAGVQVVTPLHLPENAVILVFRGWLPLAPDRRELPLAPTPATDIAIAGMLGPAPRPGVVLGEPDDLSADAWPKLITYLDLDDAAEVFGKPVLPLVLLLDADSPYGFQDRQWRATTMTPGRHAAYAFQWLAMAIAAAGCWIALGRRRGAQ